MQDPSPRASRLALTAGFIAAILVGGGGFMLGQRSASERIAPVVPAPVDQAAPAVPPPPELVSRVLDRKDLLSLAVAASDATARGQAMPAALRDAVGKRFSIALPFGCGGPAATDGTAAMSWHYDEAAGALRLQAKPVSWSPADWLPGLLPETASIEGFWIARPWTSSEACPASGVAAADDAEPVVLPGQTLAIAQLFDDEDARQGRRDGRAYTSVLRMSPDAVAGEQGFHLRLTGDIAAAPGGSSVLCRQPGGAEQRPVCIIMTTLEKVSIENAATGKTLATWDVAGTRPVEQRAPAR